MWARLDPGRANGIRDRLWAGGWYKLCLSKTSPDSPGHDLGWPRAPFGNRFRYKNKKQIQKHIKKMKPKNNGKTMTESTQNGYKMDGKIMDFPSFWRNGENAQNYVFYNIKRGSGHLGFDAKSIRI